jgi:hypothetical protein
MYAFLHVLYVEVVGFLITRRSKISGMEWTERKYVMWRSRPSVCPPSVCDLVRRIFMKFVLGL